MISGASMEGMSLICFILMNIVRAILGYNRAKIGGELAAIIFFLPND